MKTPALPVLHGIVAAALVLTSGDLFSEIIILPKGNGTVWRYLDDGSAPEDSWTSADFDDSAWKKGPAPLGYGEDGLGTTLSFGVDPDSKPIAAYFRTTFTLEGGDRERIEQIGIRLRHDDGAIVFLNGKEALRSNMPVGPVTSRTEAERALVEEEETKVLRVMLPDTFLATEGGNSVAVEIHQADPSSSDLYLDLEIFGYLAGEAPKRDVYREGMAAARKGDFEEAARLLGQLPPAHPEYLTTMAVLAEQIYGEALGRAKDGLPFAEKAYALAPGDKNIVRAYIRTHVLAGVLFDPREIARERIKEIPAELAFLVTKPDLGGRAPKVPRARLEADLDYLEHVLVHCFAYLELLDIDYRAALDAIRLSLDDQTGLDAFALRVTKLISLFGDGHASVSPGASRLFPSGYAPFVAGSYRSRVILYDAAGKGFLDSGHPYVTKIDGRPIGDWLEMAGSTVVKKSEQWHRLQSLRNLAFIRYLRAELGLPQEESLTLTLVAEDGKDSVEKKMALRARPASAPDFPRGESRRLDDIGYLRVAQMTSDPRFLDGLDQWMDDFRDTRGLIIDLRGNSGGTKNVLFTLLPYFLKPGDPMKIVEFSTYRLPMPLPKPNPGGFMMSDMSAQVLTSPRWETDTQRKQVADAIAAFKPDWPLPQGKFSDWHVLALESTTNPKAYYYEKPLVILQDSGCFSASDIFLGGFEDHPNVTLLGTPSGGGNGWMESYTLPNSGLRVVLCQSAKFRPNGGLYDTVGITPDVVVESKPEDLFGKTDTVLDAALARLRGEAGE